MKAPSAIKQSVKSLVNISSLSRLVPRKILPLAKKNSENQKNNLHVTPIDPISSPASKVPAYPAPLFFVNDNDEIRAKGINMDISRFWRVSSEFCPKRFFLEPEKN